MYGTRKLDWEGFHASVAVTASSGSLAISRGDAVPMLHNWGWSETFRPLVVVTPTSVADVARIVANAEDFPSPVRPLGA